MGHLFELVTAPVWSRRARYAIGGVAAGAIVTEAVQSSLLAIGLVGVWAVAAILATRAAE